MKTTNEKIQVLEDMRWNGSTNWDMELLDMLAKDSEPTVRAKVADYGRTEDKETFLRDDSREVQLAYVEAASYDDVVKFLDSKFPQVSSTARLVLRDELETRSAWSN